jgi:uncharacterized membrane protein (UPF0127 family)
LHLFLKKFINRRELSEGMLNKSAATTGMVCLLVIAAFMSGCTKSDKATVVLFGNNKNIEITAEIASTLQQRETGLMNRKSIGDAEGMLFIFPEPEVQSFWMKNTLIPLDLIFIEENFSVVKITYAVPCANQLCPGYSSDLPVKYVLEVNGNLTKEMRISTARIIAN